MHPILSTIQQTQLSPTAKSYRALGRKGCRWISCKKYSLIWILSRDMSASAIGRVYADTFYLAVYEIAF
jgi:hypothetical protein